MSDARETTVNDDQTSATDAHLVAYVAADTVFDKISEASVAVMSDALLRKATPRVSQAVELDWVGRNNRFTYFEIGRDGNGQAYLIYEDIDDAKVMPVSLEQVKELAGALYDFAAKVAAESATKKPQ